MSFAERMMPARRESLFNPAPERDYVWCGSAVRGDDGRYYLYYSFWPRALGFDGWVIHSQIGLAVSDRATGPFTPVGTALPAAGRGWDADCTHNPTICRFDGRYYLYYTGNYGNGEYWDHRNHQRVGVAVSDKPEGPFRRFDHPLIDVTPGGCDALLTSNPSVTRLPDGRFIMVYKAVSDKGAMPVGGAVVCGVAFADSPLGPFVKRPDPIFVNPENDWSVEDPFIWVEQGRLHALVKDFQGFFTRSGKGQTALFDSDDGINWRPAETPLAYANEIIWADGLRQAVHRLERPQLLIEDGRPIALFCACAADTACSDTFNISFELAK